MSAVLETLRAGCKNGDYYAPLQSFKALVNRKASGPRKNFDDAVSLIFQGASGAAEGLCGEVVADLCGDSLVQLFLSFQKPLDAETVRLVQQVSELFTSTGGDVFPMARQVTWSTCHANVLENFMRWAANASRGETLSEADRDVVPVLLASAHHKVFRLIGVSGENKSVAVNSLVRAARVIVKTTINPSLTSTVLSSVISAGHPNEKNVLSATFVGDMLQLVESRPSARASIIVSAKRVVFSCSSIPEVLSNLLRVAFRVIDGEKGSRREKSEALRYVLVESPCAVSLMEVNDRERLLQKFEKLIGDLP